MSFTLRSFRNPIFYKTSTLLSRFECRNVIKVQSKTFKKKALNEKPSSKWKIFGIASIVGIGFGAVYSYKNMKTHRLALLNSNVGKTSLILKEIPDFTVSRKVVYPNDASGLELILFQYPTCPFCCKVRAFLDFHGLSYNVIEVNPVLRQQLKWTDYKKVPILLIKVADGYLQLNDSSMIISALTSYFHDQEISLQEVAKFYPSISFYDDNGAVKNEILNRYFLMYQGVFPKDSTKESISEERKWRKWADDVLVHTLSPNVYRNKDEALQAFQWFSEVGHWKELFPAWEHFIVVYVGAFAMWVISKRLKKKYNLKDDVRQSLYDECSVWLRELNRKGTEFHGGSKPNLADLAVYGVLSSIEGCIAFSDLLQNTKLKHWYFNMKHLINNQAGSASVAIC
ncbi:hypothetical protein O3M35_002084 [Rhynocoris fuscipes]|uniref:Glutaredoxin domain-containing protein n=1 Tax=Rhynocoris fuscipes TaxID=488301 RepID=A0AAW1CR80_9HEMI